MDIITQNTVVNQLFSLLPFEMQTRSPLFDHYTKKLTVSKTIALFTVAVLAKWSSLEAIGLQLRANPHLQEALHLEEISASQLSRKLKDVPTEFLQELFLRLAKKRQEQLSGKEGVSPSIGKLGLVDSTSIPVPRSEGDWARLSVKDSSIKMHLRLIAVSPEEVYPDHMIPSTRNYDDREVAISMFTVKDVTYVMDRGYVQYKLMDGWVVNGYLFVIRLKENHTATVIEQRPLPEGTFIKSDCIVRLGSHSNKMNQSVRLVEFLDDKGRLYRLATTRYDLSAEEIADIYRHRWWIELFFKWMKQHLKLAKVYSTHPQGVWNQLFLALIGNLLIQILRHEQGWTRTDWKVLELVVIYVAKSWESLLEEMSRKATHPSRGRQRPRDSPKKEEFESRVGLIKPRNPNPKKRKSRSKTKIT